MQRSKSYQIIVDRLQQGNQSFNSKLNKNLHLKNETYNEVGHKQKLSNFQNLPFEKFKLTQYSQKNLYSFPNSININNIIKKQRLVSKNSEFKYQIPQSQSATHQISSKNNEFDNFALSQDSQDKYEKQAFKPISQVANKLQKMLLACQIIKKNDKVSNSQIMDQEKQSKKNSKKSGHSDFFQDSLQFQSSKARNSDSNGAKTIKHSREKQSLNFSQVSIANMLSKAKPIQFQKAFNPKNIFSTIANWQSNLIDIENNQSNILSDQFQKQILMDTSDQFISNKIEKELILTFKNFVRQVIQIQEMILQKNQTQLLQQKECIIENYQQELQSYQIEKKENKHKFQKFEHDKKNLKQIIVQLMSNKKLNQNQKVSQLINDNQQLIIYTAQLEKAFKMSKQKEKDLLKILEILQNSGVKFEKVLKNHNYQKLMKQSFSSSSYLEQNIEKEIQYSSDTRQGFADNSVINDSDESSFHYYGRSEHKDEAKDLSEFLQKQDLL